MSRIKKSNLFCIYKEFNFNLPEALKNRCFLSALYDAITNVLSTEEKGEAFWIVSSAVRLVKEKQSQSDHSEAYIKLVLCAIACCLESMQKEGDHSLLPLPKTSDLATLYLGVIKTMQADKTHPLHSSFVEIANFLEEFFRS